MGAICKASLFAITAFSMVGCSDNFQDIKPVEVSRSNYIFASDVIQEAKCELGNGITSILEKHGDRYVFPVALTTFTLEVKGENNPTGSLTPANTIDQVVLAVAGSFDNKRSSKKKMQLKVEFDMNDRCDEKALKDVESNLIQGKIGLEEWIMELAKIAGKTDKAPTYGSFNINFGIVSAGKLASTITEAGITPPAVRPPSSPGVYRFDFGHTRTVSHELDITAVICDTKKKDKYDATSDCGKFFKDFKVRRMNGKVVGYIAPEMSASAALYQVHSSFIDQSNN